MRILVTGSSGFIGQHLCDFLESKGIEVLPISLRSDDWVERIDISSNAIIHLAGKAHDTTNTSNPEEYYIINRDLTIQLFEKFLSSDIQDFIYFSSVKAVADEVSGTLTEKTEPNPLTPYGKSKLGAEKYIQSCNIPEGKRVFILRPCMVHGPGNKGNLNLLYNVVDKGIPWPLAAFSNKQSLLNIDNLLYIVHQLLIREKLKGGVYQLSDDGIISTNEIVNLISKASGRNSRLWKIHPKLIYGLAKTGDVLKLPLTTERLKKLTENYVVSNEKIKRELEIENMPFNLKDGLLKTLSSFN